MSNLRLQHWRFVGIGHWRPQWDALSWVHCECRVAERCQGHKSPPSPDTRSTVEGLLDTGNWPYYTTYKSLEITKYINANHGIPRTTNSLLNFTDSSLGTIRVWELTWSWFTIDAWFTGVATRSSNRTRVRNIPRSVCTFVLSPAKWSHDIVTKSRNWICKLSGKDIRVLCFMAATAPSKENVTRWICLGLPIVRLLTYNHRLAHVHLWLLTLVVDVIILFRHISERTSREDSVKGAAAQL